MLEAACCQWPRPRSAAPQSSHRVRQVSLCPQGRARWLLCLGFPPSGCWFSLTGRHSKHGMSGCLFPVRLGTLRVDSPWHLSAQHCFLDTCFLLTAPFRSMLLTWSSGRQRLTPTARGIPVYPKVLPHSYFTLSRRTISKNNVLSIR